MRGWRRVWIVLAALVALLVAALALWPASLAIAWFAPENSPLRYGGVQGTVWSGRLSGASVSGLRLGDVDWTLSPWSLLLRRPQVALRFSGDLDGRAGLRREGGVVALDDVELRFPARWLEPALDLPGMSLTGRVVLTVPRGTVHGVLLADLQGTAVWLDAGMRGAANAALGEFGAEFASTPLGGLAGRVEDRAGPLSVQGTFNLALTGYELDARIAPRVADPAIHQALQLLGERAPDGTRRFQAQGRLLLGASR